MLDAEAAQLRAAVRARLFEEPAAVTHIGRYEIREQLGRGGMGVVYAAFDPQLGRVVALKVLRPARDGAGRDAEGRLLQEARALARLSHPHVVTIYAAGRVDGQVFLSMERLVGTTLRGWLEAETRSTRAVFRVFAQAARGLAAAHHAGLVHRDFKPDNVMITTDSHGQPHAVVVDFGLAQGEHDGAPEAGLGEVTLEVGPELSSEVGRDESGRPATDDTRAPSRTGTGWVMGTRAYMAPELRDTAASASSDLYAFALSLCEGVGATTRSDSGRLRVAWGDVPWRVRGWVRRSLDRDPVRRGGDLESVAAALDRALARPRQLVVGVGLLALGAAAVVPWMRASPVDGCAELGARIGEVWSPARQAKIADALAEEPAFVGEAWAAAAADVDVQVDALTQDAQIQCRATRSAGGKGAAALRRLHCLEGTVVALDETLRWMESQPGVSGGHVTDAWLRFGLREACENVDGQEGHMASSPLRAHLSRGWGALRAGQPEGAMREGSAALTRARSEQVPVAVAEATLLLGRAERTAGKFDEAQARFYSAIEVAGAAAADRIAAQAWISLLEVTTQDLARFDEARRLRAPARGAVARVGEDAVLGADLAYAEAMLEDRSGNPRAALPHYRAALAVYETELTATHPSVQHTLHGLALALRRIGEPEASLPHARRALALSIEGVGARHPDVGLNHISVGAGLSFLGRRQDALVEFSAAVEILEAALGPAHPNVAAALHDRGNALASLQRFDDAYADLSRAHAIDDRSLAADNPTRAQSLYGLAMVQRARGNTDDAQALMRKALELQERVWGTEHPDLAYVVGGLGDLALDAERLDDAREHYARALRLLRPALGAEHPRLVYPLMGSVRVELADKAYEPAIALATTAVSIATAGASEPLLGVEARLLLARALHGHDPTAVEAKRTIATAAASCAALEPRGGPLCEAVRDWPPGSPP